MHDNHPDPGSDVPAEGRRRTARATLFLRAVLAALFIASAVPLVSLHAEEATLELLDQAWPRVPGAPLNELGHGVGVVFSPDLSVEGNCRFYLALGFACFQDADWNHVLDSIRNYNIFHPENRIRTLVLETHGTNGNGLKLQQSYDPKAKRSYVSVGALQERLEPDGIRTIIISACNSGRLLRPAIYRALDPNCGDKLFLPATCGIVNASDDYDHTRSQVLIVTPASSHIETTLAASVAELSPAARRVITAAARAANIKTPTQFAISDLMMQMILRDPRLTLSTRGYVEDLSAEIVPESFSERLYTSLVHQIDANAARDVKSLPPVRLSHVKAKRRTARQTK